MIRSDDIPFEGVILENSYFLTHPLHQVVPTIIIFFTSLYENGNNTL